jgi:hypothetical protein
MDQIRVLVPEISAVNPMLKVPHLGPCKVIALQTTFEALMKLGEGGKLLLKHLQLLYSQ